MKNPVKVTSLVTLSLLFAGLTWVSAGRPAERCQNVNVQGSGILAIIEVSPGVFALGFPPQPVTYGDVPGLISSFITSMSASGQGAQHFTLQHTFQSTDPARPGSFITSDRAVCGQAGSDPNTCIVSDHLTIISGSGIFANATGSLHNRGLINLNDFTLSYDVHGRMCGDGL
jgi:hypothetical protein